MKNMINSYEFKKMKTPIPSKKNSCGNSFIFKELTYQLPDYLGQPKSHKVSKQMPIFKDKPRAKDHKDEQKTTYSKKSSVNHLKKKSSRAEVSGIDMKSIYHKMTDNYIIETHDNTRFEFQDTKQIACSRALTKDVSKENQRHNEESKKLKNVKVTLETKATIQVNIKIQRKLFNYLYIIGKGGFGKVWKVEHKKTKNQYAMKQMLKSMYFQYYQRVMTKKSVQSVMNERVLLSQFNSPFVVNMHFAFQDRDTLYLVLDLMEGGDLRYHIGNKNFSEIQAKFFIACIILGLEDLHTNKIIHRDIKPQNLVLDSRGYIRITDLGIARIQKQNNSCDTSGTPGYMSPEVICRQNHGFGSDFFAVGVIAYELMTGKRPYNGKSRNQIRDLMLAKQVQLKKSEVPQDWSYEAADFINKLIQRKPQNRLGSNGISQIKKHQWLDGIKWEHLRSKEIQSPFIPMMKKSNFDQDEQITIQDQDQAELIQKHSLLLRKPQFQDLFNTYYFDKNEIEKEKVKTTNKRMISAFRKSTQNEKQPKYTIIPNEKKASHHEVPHVAKKKISLVQKNRDKQKKHEFVDRKKYSANYQRQFFDNNKV